jgi:hypothetical protein
LTDEIHLFFDDTGSRHPDHEPRRARQDGMDCFGLGGVLINKEDVTAVWDAHRKFCDEWKIDYPLHSHEIRGGRGNFTWLKNPERAVEFLPALNQFLIDLPVIGMGAVVHRPGYVERYTEKYAGSPWNMDKTAFMILIERCAKYARSQERVLRVFFEESGKSEDRDILAFTKDLKRDGLPFDGSNSEAYRGLSAEEFRAIVLGEPKRRSKQTPMLQIADLYLYPIAKGGYDPSYRAYAELMNAGRLIDAVLKEEDRSLLGIKYSCFDKLESEAKT